MKSDASAAFWRCYHAAPEHVRKKARRAFALWLENSRHPSLHFKRAGGVKTIYSVRIDDNWRVLGEMEGDIITWFWLGPHDAYERILPGE